MKRSLIALVGIAGLVLSAVAFAPIAGAQGRTGRVSSRTIASPTDPFCERLEYLCTKTNRRYNYEGTYTGHDEPSVLFYSNKSGAGSNMTYQLTLPTDPPKQPQQDGRGSTWGFQLHPAFWFGLAMCDSQSYPEWTNTCPAASDSNIFASGDPHSPRFVGHHPGTAFMELQFYPPGWAPWPAGISCDPTKWCGALTVDSLTESPTTLNNDDCLERAGEEYVNFAFLTLSGKPHGAPSPLQADANSFTPNHATDLFMDSGDRLTVKLADTPSGLRTIVQDKTTGKKGWMTASAGNGFAQVNYRPTAKTCSQKPYNFHPMYQTSTPRTYVPWAAHTYNVAFSDEIGHFEYCNAVHPKPIGDCTSPGRGDGKVDADDSPCFDKTISLLVPITGCIGVDQDFDGTPYRRTWPGTFHSPSRDRAQHPTSELFSSPVFNGGTNYGRVAFETDLPAIEFATKPACDVFTGDGCVNPPKGSVFYPFYSTVKVGKSCMWGEGGPYLPNAINTFGGSSATEYGKLFSSVFPTSFTSSARGFFNFQRVLPSNPCKA